MLDPTPELPDDMSTERVRFPARIRNALTDAGLGRSVAISVADVGHSPACVAVGAFMVARKDKIASAQARDLRLIHSRNSTLNTGRIAGIGAPEQISANVSRSGELVISWSVTGLQQSVSSSSRAGSKDRQASIAEDVARGGP